MSQSLLAALDDARTLIQQGGTDVPPAPCTCGARECDGLPASLTDRIVAWYAHDPDRVSALYAESGLTPPRLVIGAARSWFPHGSSASFKVRAALENGGVWPMADLKRVSGGTENAIRQTVFKMKARGCVVSTVVRNRQCCYQQETA